MSLTLLSITVSLAVSLPASWLPPSAISQADHAMKGKEIIVQQYRDSDPHGSDPHGSDPHDEIHDLGLKANAMDNARAATDDVYGGNKNFPVNSQRPLDNLPGQPGF